MFKANVTEKSHSLCLPTFFFFSNPALYEITWKHTEQPDTRMNGNKMRITKDAI